MPLVAKVMMGAQGQATPHDGLYVASWNPRTENGVLELSSTDDINRARWFPSMAALLREWRMVSTVEPMRANDGRPNRPLTAVTIEILNVPGGTA